MHSLTFDKGSWHRALHVFLTRSESNKPKPLRRLLLTLINIVAVNPEEKIRSKLIEHAIGRATKVIRKEDDQASVRAAMQVLEQLISKGLVDASAIIRPRGFQDIKRFSTNSATDGTSELTFFDRVESFTSEILEWVQYPDCAPVSGRLLAAFFKSLQKLDIPDADHGVLDKTSPSWILPVKQALERQPDLLEVYENHILPDLLRLSPLERAAFLDILPFPDIQKGKVGKNAVSDVQLCLLVARIDSNSADSPCSKKSQERHTTNTAEKEVRRPNGVNALIRDNRSVSSDGVQLGINLLDHSSPAVRINALSLLISSPACKHYFKNEVLDSFQICLPYFQVEVNVKARNEFIALMSKLCKKLNTAITFLLRENKASSPVSDKQGQRVNSGSAVINKQENPSTTKALEEHLSFRSWYLRFLVHELRSTSPYQSHITALKVLHLLLERKTNDQVIEGCHLSPLLRSLLDLLLDPFNDVRESANSLFQKVLSLTKPPLATEVSDEDDVAYNNKGILVALQRAESKAAETGRADHADGVGRLYNVLYDQSKPAYEKVPWHENAALILEHLISRLESEVVIAKQDLSLAVGVAPVHGHLIALR